MKTRKRRRTKMKMMSMQRTSQGKVRQTHIVDNSSLPAWHCHPTRLEKPPRLALSTTQTHPMTAIFSPAITPPWRARLLSQSQDHSRSPGEAAAPLPSSASPRAAVCPQLCPSPSPSIAPLGERLPARQPTHSSPLLTAASRPLNPARCLQADVHCLPPEVSGLQGGTRWSPCPSWPAALLGPH